MSKHKYYHIIYVEDNPPIKMFNITRFLEKDIAQNYGVMFAYKMFEQYFGSLAEYDAFDVYVSFIPVKNCNYYKIDRIEKD